ncbi:MAG: beta strand repeat-containing protein [Planctomycetia bacterium]
MAVGTKKRRRGIRAPLAVERLDDRRMLSVTSQPLPITFTVPVEIAKQGVYAAVFGAPTTTSTTAVQVNAAGTGLNQTSIKLTNGSLYPNQGQFTIQDGIVTIVVGYTGKSVDTGSGLWTFSGLSYVSGAANASMGVGSDVWLAGPAINQASFVYLTSSSGGPAQTSTGGAMLNVAGSGASLTPTVSGSSITGFTSLVGGSGYTMAPVLQFSQPQVGSAIASATATISTTGPNAGQVTGWTNLNGGLGYTSATVTVVDPTTAGIAPTATRLPVNSVAGFPTTTALNPIPIVMSLNQITVRATYTGLDTTPGYNAFTGVTFLDQVGVNNGFSVSLGDVFAGGSTFAVNSTAGFAPSGTLLVQAPAAAATSTFQASTNAAVSYTGISGNSFTGVSAFPSGALPQLLSGGFVYQMPGPTDATSYAPLPTSGNLPLINLFPSPGSLPASGTTQATITLPDPSQIGLTSGVIVLSVGTPIPLQVLGKRVNNAGLEVTVPTVGSPTPGTNADDVFGLFEFGLTSGSLDFDVSEVDQVGFPFSVTTQGAPPPVPADPVNGVGMRQDRTTLFDGFSTFINNTSLTSQKAWQFLRGTPNAANAPFAAGTRITAPQDITGVLLTNPPTLTAVTPVGGAGTGATASYWITAIGATGGESMASAGISGTSTSSNAALQLTWSAYPYATGYNVYWSASNDVTTARKIASNVQGLAFTDQTPGSHSGTVAPPPTSNYLYDPLNSYYTTALQDFFAYYAPATLSPFGIQGAGNTFVLDDQATATKWTGQTQTALTIGAAGGYTALVLTGSQGTWGGTFAGQTIWVVAPFFSSNTGNSSLPPAPAPSTGFPAAKSGESPATMLFAGDGVFGNFSATSMSGGDSANLYNNIVSAFNRGLTPTRSGNSWNAVLPPTYWANSPVLKSVTPGYKAGDSLAGDATYRYFITAVGINGDTSTTQTTPSVVVEKYVPAGYNNATVEWTAVNPAGSLSMALTAKGFNIYRSYKRTDGSWTTPVFWGYQANSGPNGQTKWIDTGVPPTGSASTLFTYYAPGTTSNWYAAYFSRLDVSFNGLSYGYPYADKNGQSTNVQIPYPTTNAYPATGQTISGLAVTFNRWATGATTAPVVQAPAQFNVTQGVAGNLVWPASFTPVADPYVPLVTATLTVTGGTGTLTAAPVAGRVAVRGSDSATLQITSSVADLNTFLKTPGSVTYTATGPSLTPRTLTFSATDGTLTGTSATSTINVAPGSTLQAFAPRIGTMAWLQGGQQGQWLEISYAQLVAATRASPTTRSLQFVVDSVPNGTLQTWNGRAWVTIPPTVGRFGNPSLPLMSAGGKIRWMPGFVPGGRAVAFSVRVTDGARTSSNACAVSIAVTR